jgi:spermidine synthase
MLSFFKYILLLFLWGPCICEELDADSVSSIKDITIPWSEYITTHHHYYVDVLALLQHNQLVNPYIDVLHEFHNIPDYPIDFYVQCPIDENNRVSEQVHEDFFPLLRYLISSRIAISSNDEIELIWEKYNGHISADFILSLQNEMNVISMTLDRLRSFQEDLKDLPETDPELEAKQGCLKTFEKSFSFIEEMLRNVSKMDVCREHHRGDLRSQAALKSFRMDESIFEDTAINVELFRIVIHNYLQFMLSPFLEDDRMCSQAGKTLNLVRYVYPKDFDATIPDIVYNIIVETTPEHIEDMSTCLSHPSLMLTIDQSILEKENVLCTKSKRVMYRYLVLIIFSVNKLLTFDAFLSINSSDSNIGRLFHSTDGSFGGSFSINNVVCVSHEDNAMDATCIYGDETMAWYNRLKILAAMVVSPSKLETALEPVDVNMEDPTATSLFAGKILTLGLGSGSLMSYINSKFPSVMIDNVDIDPLVVDIALNDFGGKYITCDVLQLDGETAQDASHLVNSTKTFLDEYISIQNKTIFYDKDGKRLCRNKIFVADAWNYIDNFNKQLAKHLPPVFYDYVFIDVFDSMASYWSGELFEDQSNPLVEGFVGKLEQIKNMLSPNGGAVVYHIHKDSSYEYYRSRIIEVFGKRNVVHFAVSRNDGLVVGTRGIFDTQQHPCEALPNFENSIFNIANRLSFRNRDSYGSQYSLDCQYEFN